MCVLTGFLLHLPLLLLCCPVLCCVNLGDPHQHQAVAACWHLVAQTQPAETGADTSAA